MRREKSLESRKKYLQELMEWKERLDKEEAEIVKKEKKGIHTIKSCQC